MRGLSFRTIETVATDTFAIFATSRRLTDFPPAVRFREAGESADSAVGMSAPSRRRGVRLPGGVPGGASGSTAARFISQHASAKAFSDEGSDHPGILIWNAMLDGL